MSSSTDAMASPCSHDQFDVRDPVLNMVFQAAFVGELSVLKELVMMLDMGRGRPKEAIEELRVEDVGQLGFSALHVAANGESLEVCWYLVEELLLDVDLVDNEGRTPLFFARYHNGGTAEYLLDHGANPDKASHDGFFLLHYAAELGNCEMVEPLLAKGAYVDPVAARGTPLHVAAGEGHYGAMKILLDHNADYNKMVNGVTPLMAAADANSTKCIKLLVKVQEEPMLKRETVTSGLYHSEYLFKEKGLCCRSKIVQSDRSLCWLHMGHGRKALLDANKCKKLRPHWPKACHRQGEALMLLKDYEGASERFLDGLKLDPVDTDIEDALREAMRSLKMSRSMKAK